MKKEKNEIIEMVRETTYFIFPPVIFSLVLFLAIEFLCPFVDRTKRSI